MHNHIDSTRELEEQFRSQLGKKEIYKALKDIIESSQNVLLIIDEEKPELPEVLKTYTDTWDKMVTVEILKKFSSGEKAIFTLTPDFENIEDIGIRETTEREDRKYTESFQTEGVEKDVLTAYDSIKNAMLSLDPAIEVNP